MDSYRYLQEFVDPIFTPLLEEVLVEVTVCVTHGLGS
jgi:hypothetical protein